MVAVPDTGPLVVMGLFATGNGRVFRALRRLRCHFQTTDRTVPLLRQQSVALGMGLLPGMVPDSVGPKSLYATQAPRKPNRRVLWELTGAGTVAVTVVVLLATVPFPQTKG